jgi:hypothetical protein
MRVSRAEAAQNRERIIEVAARLFRERGFNGIGVAELMKFVGLTHGGFYGHFASKEDLMAQACARWKARWTPCIRWPSVAAGTPCLPSRPLICLPRTVIGQARDARWRRWVRKPRAMARRCAVPSPKACVPWSTC